MTIYGDAQEPGIITDLTSSAAVGTNGASERNVGLVGQADLANAVNPADTDTVYQVTRASTAVELFGPTESSLLTTAIVDALNEGAFPVFATVTPSVEVSDDISGVSSTTIDLEEAPIREDPQAVDVSVDGTGLTSEIVYDSVSDYSPQAGEAVVNPVRGRVEVPETPSSSGAVDYESFDYSTAIDVMVNLAAEQIDFLVPLSENGAAVDAANVAVGTMEQEYNLALAVGGADINLDPLSFSQQYDDSRTQTIYPTRFADGSSALAAYVGKKAALGLLETPVNKRLLSNKRLIDTLDRAARGTLIDNNVVPLANEARGARIVDDPTTVADDNTDEGQLNFGFNRLVADYIIETTRDNERPFIGKLNSQVVRNTLEGLVTDSLTDLQQSNAVVNYDINISKDGPTQAGLEMRVELVKPLRYIENTVTIGPTQ